MKRILYTLMIAIALIYSSSYAVDASGVVVVDKEAEEVKLTCGNYKYTIASSETNSMTVCITGMTKKAKKKLKKVTIPDSIKIKSGDNGEIHEYDVTAISRSAFANNHKITSVYLGDNLGYIGRGAFEHCNKLKTVSSSGKCRLNTIKKYAFNGCTKLKKFDLSKYESLDKIEEHAFDDTPIGKKIDKQRKGLNITKYSYEVYPLLPPFNNMYYIKTDNPDPTSFRLYDKSSVYDKPVSTSYNKDGSIKKQVHNCSIAVVQKRYSDVVYEDQKTYRVKGGYIGYSTFANVDGGTLTLQTTPKDMSDSWDDEGYSDTSVTIKMEKVVDLDDYLINTFDKPSEGLFERLKAINDGFEETALYSGAWVKGELVKNKNYPYYGISNSPHADQEFYIQDPYGRTNNKLLLASDMHPMICDSYATPRIMGRIALKLNPNVTVELDSYYHYIANVTYNGVTKGFGGNGNGGGKGINEDMIKYYFTFDGSDSDCSKNMTYDRLSAILNEYGDMEMTDDIPKEDMLTWEKIRNTVGTNGAYIKIINLNTVRDSLGDYYTFMYDNGSKSEGGCGSAGAGCFCNAWYDGRYFNKFETIEKGIKFGDKSRYDGTDSSKAGIIVKDACIKLPDDGREYTYNYNTIDRVSRYNPTTGVWSGFTRYNYNSKEDVWIAEIGGDIRYFDEETGTHNYCYDEKFLDACTLTRDEVNKMNVDRNTSKDPEEYYDYTRTMAPGSKCFNK